MEQIHIAALGEILIDYTPLPDSDAGMSVFEQNPGGAPANVLACAARLGRRTAFIGKVGDDIQGRFLADTLRRTGIDTRATILGHVQRGGSPTLRDRVNASAMGYHAVCLLEQGKYNRIVGMKGEKLVDYPVDEALEMTKSLDPVLVDVCNTISI